VSTRTRNNGAQDSVVRLLTRALAILPSWKSREKESSGSYGGRQRDKETERERAREREREFSQKCFISIDPRTLTTMHTRPLVLVPFKVLLPVRGAVCSNGLQSDQTMPLRPGRRADG
jgi:hypothetical protein